MAMRAGSAEEQRRALDIAYRRADLTLEDLWLRYFTLGGAAGLVEVEAYLHGLLPLDRHQRDVLAHAVNEHLDDLTTRLRVPYSRPLRAPTPASGPLAALTGLLDDTRQAAPERLLKAVTAAASALGARVVLYLVDYDQRHLVPVEADTARPGTVTAGPPLGVEATMAGQAFQHSRTMTSDGEHPRRLWVPVLDGVERLGVLEIATDDDDVDVADPQLRRECLWVANLVGHLITTAGNLGDALDAVRRTRPRTASAELVWDLLPPLTAGTDRFLVAGRLEPSHAVGGDAFDYALSEETASLAIFDATGHSLASGLATAAALAAYRSTRRSGGGLFHQALAIDDVLAEHFADRAMYVSGILAEVDIRSGRLRYVLAGHPAPLLIRGSKVVKALDRHRRALFGLPQDAMSIGEEALQPGDRLFLYTDGVTEARDAGGRFFGAERLESFLERADAAGFPPSETVRRLTAAVMDHQGGHLQDDATVLLASWLPRRPQAPPAP